MRKLLYICFLIPFVTTSAQNLDSLYNAFLAVKGVTQINAQQNVSIQSEPIKCSFGIVSQTALNYNKFPYEQKAALSILLQRPAMDTSFVTPGGKFRIHFKKTGFDAPGYDLNELARAADSSYNYEVNVLGYPPPPKDFGKSNISGNPDDLYDIFIQNTGKDYGYTQPDSMLNNSTYTSFIVIDNDFGSGYNTYGIDGARVTIAHELHHAIQIGNYIYRDSDNFYYEITSMAMEDFVYPDINDYIYYIATYFRNTQRSFGSTSYDGGYNRGIFNIFLRDRFGIDIIKRIWELMPAERAMQAIADAIQEKGSSFKVEFNTFGLWTYFTGERSIPNKYFEDAAKFPLINPMVLTSPMTVNSEAVSNNFFQYNDFTSAKRDSVITLVTNSDLKGATDTPVKILPFTYTLTIQQINGGKQIADGFYSKLESANISLFAESNVLTGHMSVEEIDYAYPQPFRYSVHNQLFIPVTGIKGETVELSIFSVDMNLVYSGQKRVRADQVILWDDVFDLTGKKLGTGVYLYVTKSGDTIKKGKFVVYND